MNGLEPYVHEATLPELGFNPRLQTTRLELAPEPTKAASVQLATNLGPVTAPGVQVMVCPPLFELAVWLLHATEGET